MLEKISRFQEEGPMVDVDMSLSDTLFQKNEEINLQVIFAQLSEHPRMIIVF